MTAVLTTHPASVARSHNPSTGSIGASCYTMTATGKTLEDKALERRHSDVPAIAAEELGKYEIEWAPDDDD